jgi:hypothetical protein
MHKFTIYTLLFTLLTCCVRYEDDNNQSSANSSPLEQIKAELNRPKQAQTEPTAKPKKERWKAYGNKNPDPATIEEQQRAKFAEVRRSQEQASWPAKVGNYFPTMLFLTPNGDKRSIDEFKGRPILIEYVSMSSTSSQAFSGSQDRGSFLAIPINKNFQSLEKYFPVYSSGVHAHEITLMQILLLGPKGRPVDLTTAKNWTKHFELEQRGRIVLIATSALLRNDGSQLLGGFQLLDKNLVVRADATGERSKTLFSQLFPLIKRIK